jgi:hypothetical protein
MADGPRPTLEERLRTEAKVTADAPREVWVVYAPTPVLADYVCTYREGAMEHAAEVAEISPQLGPWGVAHYIRADLAAPQVPRELVESLRAMLELADERTTHWWNEHPIEVKRRARSALEAYDAAPAQPEVQKDRRDG